jgi:hypothetical protein
MNAIPCPFCSPPTAPRGGMKIALLATDLCAEHLEMSGIPEYERRHPLVGNTRSCNDSCGCFSLEELDAELGAEDQT